MSDWRPMNYSAHDLAQMQMDAERRVREMQRRVRQSSGGLSPAVQPEPAAPVPQHSPAPSAGTSSGTLPFSLPDFLRPRQGEKKGFLSALQTAADAFGIEQDHIILLLLLFLLLQSDDEDKTILMALGYILL